MHSNRTYMAQSVIFMMVIMAIFASKIEANCAFQAIFNFGDSNSDTGGFYAAFPSQPSPFGMTYFKRPSGRASDGRIYIDFLAQALGLPFISPYLQSIGSDYSHGANFATLASTVLQPTTIFNTGLSPFYLGVQLNQMKLFKSKVDESGGHGNLPSSDIFGKALYTINIGQNDISSYLSSSGRDGVIQNAPQLISQITNTVKELYTLGGRTFLVFSIGPIGCYPRFLAAEQSQSGRELDSAGCKPSYNNVVKEYNNMSKGAIQQTKNDLSDANIIYVNTYELLLDLYQAPNSHGFQHGTTACCGQGGGAYNFNPEVFCGSTKTENGQTVSATACSDPQNYVSWDGVHFTEAANKIMTYGILSGSYNDPPVSLSQYCDIQPIG